MAACKDCAFAHVLTVMTVADRTRQATGDPLAAFTSRAERAASVVHPCPALADVARLVNDLAKGGPVGVSPRLARRYPALLTLLEGSVDLLFPSTGVEAGRMAVGLSLGEALVAETGSVLVSEYELADRLISMLSPILVQVVPREALIRTLDEVGAMLARETLGGTSGYHALVTGPSRSADIERSLTVGVQGPAEVHIAILASEPLHRAAE